MPSRKEETPPLWWGKIAIALQLLLRWGDAPLLPPATSLKIATLKSHYTVEECAVGVVCFGDRPTIACKA